MADPMVIGQRLRALRTNAKESIAETSSAVGISESALRMYEIGQRIPRDEVKERIAAHFCESIESIFFSS